MTTRRLDYAEWTLLRPEERIVLVAERQRGVITYRQLKSCGMTRTMVDERVRRGLLHRVHRGVYLVGHRVMAPLARETAALLACGPGAVISHWSAAILWDLPVLTSAVDVTVAPPRRPRHEGIATHRSVLREGDVTTRHGIPLTTPRRTIQDIAEKTPPAELERCIGELRGRRLIQDGDIEAIPDRRGATAIRAVLDAGPRWTRSEAERAFLQLIRASGLPGPETNVKLAEHLTVDALWRPQCIAVEVDSWAWHGTRAAFERDPRRDQRVRELGLTPVRVTAHQIGAEPHRVVAHLATLLATRE